MPQRIMVFDNDPDTLTFFEELLSIKWYAVVPRHCARVRLHEVIAAAPDLILLDCMFGSNAAGHHLLERLKACPATATVPVIVCMDDPQVLEAYAAEWEAMDVPTLPKPFELAELDRLLATRLS